VEPERDNAKQKNGFKNLKMIENVFVTIRYSEIWADAAGTVTGSSVRLGPAASPPRHRREHRRGLRRRAPSDARGYRRTF
jgi:hypothetical protein